MGEKKGSRVHSPEFRVSVAERMLSGEKVAAIAAEFELPRSMMYRWRDTYRREGPQGLSRKRGQRPGIGHAPLPTRSAPNADSPDADKPSQIEEKLRAQIAELERKVGKQAVAIDFFKRVFKRLEELPEAPKAGGEASTPRSGERRGLKTERD